MKEKIDNLIQKYKEINLLQSLILEKEQTVLGCINLLEKSVGEEKVNISSKQKNIGISLLEDRNNLLNKENEIKKFLEKSFCNLSKNNIISESILINISKENLKILKNCLNKYL